MRDGLSVGAPPPDAAAHARTRHAGGILAGVDRQRLVVRRWRFRARIVRSDEEVRGGLYSICSLAEALAKADPLVMAHVGKTFATEDVAVALNTALMGDGAVITIAAGVTPRRANPS